MGFELGRSETNRAAFLSGDKRKQAQRLAGLPRTTNERRANERMRRKSFFLLIYNSANIRMFLVNILDGRISLQSIIENSIIK